MSMYSCDQRSSYQPDSGSHEQHPSYKSDGGGPPCSSNSGDALLAYSQEDTVHARHQIQDDVNIEALFTNLQSSFPSEQQPLLLSESVSLISDVSDYAEIKPYEYTIHDLRSKHTDSQKRNMTLPVQSNQSSLPNPFPELEKTAATTDTQAGILSGSRTAPASPAVQVRVKKGSLTPPLSRKNNNNNTLKLPAMDGVWGSQMIHAAEDRTSCDSTRRICINFYNGESSNDSYKTLVVNEGLTSADISHLLILKNHAVQDKNWLIVEYLHHINAERSLEDHERVLQIWDTWGRQNENRFVFRKDFKKYELFQNPTLYFPSQMTNVQEEQGVVSDKVERQRQVLLQNLMSSSDRLPDLQGYLHMKEAGKKSWKKAFFLLRGSGLYYSSKGTSKDPKHLVAFCQFLDINVYSAITAKKTFHAPTPYAFCFKPENVSNIEPKELKCLCAEDEKNRTCWIAGIRLAKDNGSDPKDRVAMDFTGVHGGRVVDDPNEAIGVAIEEGHQWRKKITRPSLASSPNGRSPSGNSSPSLHKQSSPSTNRRFIQGASLNMMQPWFHHGISRDDANQLIARQGLTDGVFLIRESKMMTGCFVLSCAHNLRVKHFQISPIEDDGHLYYTLDGNTKFGDLIQLVDFFQLNAGGLPVKLTHYVTKLA